MSPVPQAGEGPPVPRMSRQRERVVALGGLILMTAAAPAAAQPAAVAPTGSGVTAPAGIVRAPGGDLWVADPARGVCRVAETPQPYLVESRWCADEEAHAGPDEASGLVLDPETGNLYASD